MMPERKDVSFADLDGIALYHAARSNCSARVRLLLAEKGLDWNSHVISLMRRENRRPEYFAINPKGLVPSLIHDGWVITESNDILFYIEAKFPNPSFTPGAVDEHADMVRWMRMSADLHLPGVKTFNYSGMKTVAQPGAQDAFESYEALQTDQELLKFHEKASISGFSTEERAQAQAILADALGEMDRLLAKQSWLAGDSYSLADICWVTTMPTLDRSGFDLAPFARVLEWRKRIAARPAYADSVTGWEDAPR
jgi:glutathione S-transferase